MSCKPGDLARIVPPYGWHELRGLHVTVVRAATFGEVVCPKLGLRTKVDNDSLTWVCDAHHEAFPRVISDRCLRPVPRDGVSDREVRDLYACLPELT